MQLSDELTMHDFPSLFYFHFSTFFLCLCVIFLCPSADTRGGMQKEGSERKKQSGCIEMPQETQRPREKSVEGKINEDKVALRTILFSIYIYIESYSLYL